MRHDELTSDTAIEDMIDVIRLSPKPFPDGWHSWENTKKAMRRLADERVAELLVASKPPTEWSGHGIVTAGGGDKYFPSLWVLVNQIRRVGCKLPIQLWHLGRAELDPAMRNLLAPFGVEFVDAREHEKKYPCRILNGWELKPYSILHSPFREVLFLDADDTPLRDPTPLFNAPKYRELGSILWPDHPHWTLTDKHWQRFAIDPKFPVPAKIPNDWKSFGRMIPRCYDTPIESGQLLIDKSHCWRELSLALWYCEHSDYCFSYSGQGDRVHGDKETFHLAWRKFKTEYAQPPVWPDWDIHTMTQHDMDGYPLFLHRTQDKWKYDCSVNRKGFDLAGESDLFEIAKILPTVWNGRVWDNGSPTDAEKERMTQLARKEYTYHRIGLDNGISRTMRLAADGAITEGGGEMERRWSLWSNGDTLSICGKDGLTCLLEPCSDGIWRGRWDIHEKCEVELRPVKKMMNCVVKQTSNGLVLAAKG